MKNLQQLKNKIYLAKHPTAKTIEEAMERELGFGCLCETKEEKNTFGYYTFDEWVPKNVQKMIRDFWGIFGRTHKDWLMADKEQNTREMCYHIYPQGFGMPPYGARASYFIRDCVSSKQVEKEVFTIIEGRYIHRWNNMGSLIDDNGKSHCVSTCDRWVRIFTKDEKKSEKIGEN